MVELQVSAAELRKRLKIIASPGKSWSPSGAAISASTIFAVFGDAEKVIVLPPATVKPVPVLGPSIGVDPTRVTEIAFGTRITVHEVLGTDTVNFARINVPGM